MEHLTKACGIKPVYQIKESWAEVFKTLETEEGPFIIPNVGITEKRKHLLRYTVPIESFGIGLFVRSSDYSVSNLKSIQSSGRVLLSLINDILDLSKVEAGKLSLQYFATSIPDLCSDVTNTLHQKAVDKGLSLTLELAPDIPPSLVVDPYRLKQILLNLLGNAIKFTEQGNVILSAKAALTDKTSHSRVDLTFSVSDTRIGIPKEEQAHIFEAFEQMKHQKSRNYGGTGLGLTICRRLITLIEGTLDVESEPERGTTFTIQLPGIEVAATTPRRETSIMANRKEELWFSPAKILIVDDVDYNREMLVSYLEDWDFELYFAENGQETLEQCRAHLPNLVLMNIKMPVMNGEEATRIMKKDKSLKHIPVVAVTASTLHKMEARICSLCDGYLRKPVELPVLLSELERFLPHKSVARPQEPVSSDPSSSLSSLTPPKKRSDLYDKLNALRPDQEKLCRTPLFGEANLFIENMVSLTSTYPCAELSAWIAELKLASERFDTIGLKTQLEHFPDLLIPLSPLETTDDTADNSNS